MLLESWQSDPHTNTPSQVLWTELCNPQRSFAEARTPNISMDEDVLVKAMKANGNGAMRVVWLVWKSHQGFTDRKGTLGHSKKAVSCKPKKHFQRTQMHHLQICTPGHQSG